MSKTGKMTNWDAKKAFSQYTIPRYYPTIYIDKYWDYAIELFNLKDEWNTFLEEFTKDGFTYITYRNEFNRIISEASKLLLNCTIDEAKSIIEKNLPKNDDRLPHIKFNDLQPGNYIFVDVHLAWETVMKHIGIFNTEYKDTYEIVEKITNHKIFYNSKNLRVAIYHAVLIDNQSKENICTLLNTPLLKSLYESDVPEIKYLNGNCKFMGVTGDPLIYQVPDGISVDNILGEYHYDLFDYHIETGDVKTFNLLDKKYISLKYNDSGFILTYDSNALHVVPELQPLIVKLVNGGKITEKDLAIGYEDQIFFHLDNPEE